jgi:hypothetical protein
MLQLQEGTPVKKALPVVVISFLAVLILLPVTGSVNNTASNLAFDKTFYTDGSPVPPLPPHSKSLHSTVVADGSPVPPLPPHNVTSEPTLSADGSPVPPLPPHFGFDLLTA